MKSKNTEKRLVCNRVLTGVKGATPLTCSQLCCLSNAVLS